MITAMLLKLTVAARRWYRRRRAIRELSALDDRMLRDIGIDRGQIELAVDGALRSAPPQGETLVPARPPFDGRLRELPDWVRLGYGAELGDPGARSAGR